MTSASASTSATHFAFATARALSPLFAGQSPVDPSESSKAVAARQRVTAYGSAITTTDLIMTIPPNYRDVLAPSVRSVTDIAEKLVNARASLRKLEAAQAAGHPPTHLLLKAPELQGCKEFREEGGLETAQDAITAAVNTANATVLQAAINGKKAEVDLLVGKLAGAQLFDDWKALVNSRFLEVRERSQQPVLEYVVLGDDGKPLVTTADKSTDVRVKDWVVEPTVIVEYNNLLEDLAPIARRAIMIVNQRDSAMQQKIEKKKALEKTADAEMQDVAKPGPSLQSLIDKSIRGQVKPLATQLEKLSLKSKTKGGKKSKVVAKKSDTSSKKTASSSTKKPTTSSKKSGDRKDKGKGKAKAGN